MLPVLGFSSPAISRKSVVLPNPLGAVRQVTGEEISQEKFLNTLLPS